MPKDTWAKERAKDAAWKVTVLDRNAARRLRASTHAEIRRLQSPSTRLWFGKYRNRTIQVIQQKDPAYLQWLSHQNVSDSDWRMQALVAYLKKST
jgi:hypothetical protein